MMFIKEFKNYKKPFLLNDVLLFVSVLLYAILICYNLFILPSKINENISLAIFLPLSILFFISFILYLFIEIKYNGLSINNFFFFGGLLVGLINMFVTIFMPASQVLFNNTTIVTSGIYKLYFIINGFLVSFIPFGFINIIPRRISSKTVFNILFYIGLIVIFSLILYSLIFEFDNIKIMFSSGFKELPGLKSFTFQKNIFGRILLLGIMMCFIQRLVSKKIRWFLYSIPIYIFLILCMAKMAMFCGFILLVVYLVVRLMFYVNWNKDNFIITVLIFSSFLFFIIIFAIMINFSTSGILYNIKSVFNSFINSANKTLSSRKIIWDCTFKMLKPWQYIFGYGIRGYDIAIHFVYGNDPRLPSWECLDDIWSAHNSFIELIARGGIIYLIFIIFSIGYLFYIITKIYKENKELSILFFVLIFIYIIYGLTDSNYIFGENTDFIFSFVVVVPLLSLYFNKYNKKGVEYNMKIIESLKSKNVYNSKLLLLNEKYLKLNAKLLIENK